MGFWIIFPYKPTGPSESLGFMAFDEARHTKITELINNAAHSNNHVSIPFFEEYVCRAKLI